MAKCSDDLRRYQARQEPVRCRHAGHQGRVQQGRQAVPSGWLEEQNEKVPSTAFVRCVSTYARFLDKHQRTIFLISDPFLRRFVQFWVRRLSLCIILRGFVFFEDLCRI